jgi:hypothetical protein
MSGRGRGRRHGRGRLSAASSALAPALALALAAGATSACDIQQAVDCTRLALQISTASDRIEQAVTTSLLGDDTDAFQELAEDVEELNRRIEDTEVREAADSVAEAADNLQQAVERGETPDLSPLADATSELTTVCTPSGEAD